MSRITRWLDDRFYRQYQNNWDDSMFREELLQSIGSFSVCLDFGAGRGKLKQLDFRGIAKFVAGVDPDEEVLENPHLHEAKQLDLASGVIPYPDAFFDVVFSDNVMEHVQDPNQVFREVYRVLKPGGCFVSKTPNKWHYVPTIARLTPTGFHQFYNHLRGRNTADTFPTLYRCNSRRSVTRYARASGFEVQHIRLIEGRPEYLRLMAITYLCGLLYERTVNSTQLLQTLRSVLIFKLLKPSRAVGP